MISAEKDPQRDLLKLFAYGTLANFWINLRAKERLLKRKQDSFSKFRKRSSKNRAGLVSALFGIAVVMQFAV